METAPGIDLLWWISVIEVPVMAGLFWLIRKVQSDCNETLERIRRSSETGLAQAREGLAAYKLDVAQSYASITYLKEVEKRLTNHLLRIEAKINTTTPWR